MKYVPEIYDEDNRGPFLKMLVELSTCKICQKQMVHSGKPFPSSCDFTFDAQLKKVGAVKRASLYWECVCEECVKADKLTFKCPLCGQIRPCSQSQEQFGDPPEHLCRDCYQTVPAQKWDEAVRDLEAEHRYDFE